MFDPLTTLAKPGSTLAAMASGLNWDLVLAATQADGARVDWFVTIRDGAVVDVAQGPRVMPSWQTRIIAPAEEWRAFFAPVPHPGHHDIIALLRRGAIRFEGDLHPLMAHLLYVKRLLAALRPVPEVQK
jgi:hypothetical protein